MIFNSLNLVLFLAVVNAAKAKAAAKRQMAWVRAIEKAAEQIHTNPYISETEDGLLIQSATGNEIYHANGVCQCKVYANDMPCWHRAAAQLLKRYHETEAEAASVAKPDDERERLIVRIENAWRGKYSPLGIAQGLLKRFGVNQLSMPATHNLRAIVAVLK